MLAFSILKKCTQALIMYSEGDRIWLYTIKVCNRIKLHLHHLVHADDK